MTAEDNTDKLIDRKGEKSPLDLISAHVEEYVGPIDFVIHELLSEDMHIDVHVVAPTPKRNYFTLITSGMSEFEMNVPEGMEDSKFLELAICLPANWPLSQDSFGLGNDEVYWPIEWLKALAKYPILMDTWLWLGHTIPNGDPPEQFASDTEMCCWILGVPMFCDSKFFELSIDDRKSIFFPQLLPITEQEIEFKLKHDAQRLFEQFEKSSFDNLIDPKRHSLC